MILQCPNIRTS